MFLKEHFFFLFSWKNAIVGHNRWMEDFFFFIIIIFFFLREQDSGDKSWVEVLLLLLLLFFFLLGEPIQRGVGLAKFWGKMRDGPD